MAELLQNHDRLNRLSKKFLDDLNVRSDPSQLYCLLLMEWALDTGVVKIRDSRLRGTLDNLLGTKPGPAYRFLKLAEDGEEYPPVPNLDQIDNPEDLAIELLEVLDSKVSLHSKGSYPGRKGK